MVEETGHVVIVVYTLRLLAYLDATGYVSGLTISVITMLDVMADP